MGRGTCICREGTRPSPTAGTRDDPSVTVAGSGDTATLRGGQAREVHEQRAIEKAVAWATHVGDGVLDVPCRRAGCPHPAADQRSTSSGAIRGSLPAREDATSFTAAAHKWRRWTTPPPPSQAPATPPPCGEAKNASGLRLFLAFFDRCGKSAIASSATGSAMALFPMRRGGHSTQPEGESTPVRGAGNLRFLLLC